MFHYIPHSIIVRIKCDVTSIILGMMSIYSKGVINDSCHCFYYPPIIWLAQSKTWLLNHLWSCIKFTWRLLPIFILHHLVAILCARFFILWFLHLVTHLPLICIFIQLLFRKKIISKDTWAMCHSRVSYSQLTESQWKFQTNLRCSPFLLEK